MRQKFSASFNSPDEVIEAPLVRSEHVELAGLMISHDIHEPGWHWAEHVGPITGTEWCETRHVGYVLSGRMHVVMKDGDEFDIEQGDVYFLPPGHDTWVVGDKAWESLAWMGARTWLMPLNTLKERVLATIVFTDIVDSTGIAGRMGDRAWADLVAAHDRRITETVDRYQGRIVKLTGDGMLAVFDGAARAVRCALACDDAVSDLALSLRAAVHTGEIEVSGEEIHGMSVHEAARILEIAGEHEVLLSGVTADLVSDEGCRFEDRGEHELRGVGARRRLYAASVVG